MPEYIYTDFTPQAIQPTECIRDGWNLIKDQYWLFVGISLVAILLGQLAPLGILMAPMMCGVYLTLFERMRGQRAELATLFKGFDYFGQSIVALLIHLIPMMIIIMPFVALIVIGSMVLAPTSRGNEPNPAGVSALVAMIIIGSLLMVIILIAVSVLFTFAYPLIVDRKMTGVDAVKLSVKAALANFWGLLGLMLLNALMAFAGVLCCYVGVLLVMPVGFAATACAYRQVFGLTPIETFYPPPPPGSFR